MREQSFKNANNSRPKDIRGGETKVMKKLLTSFLVFALLLTMVTPAFAASDVAGTDYEVAVERLNALEVLKGYTDGTFRPDNTITRAEFAAVAVRLLGLEAAAEVSKGATPFKDYIDNWATGYVNVAVQQGLLKGYTDGTFRATNPVTQAEALAILVRVLGYDPIVSQEGWPTNYVVKAAQIGLTKDVKAVSANAVAPRGVVALFSNNALTINKLVQTGFGATPSYTNSGTPTVLSENLNGAFDTKVLKEAKLTDDNEVQFVGLNIEVKNLKVAGGKTLADLIGHEVKYFTVNDKVVLVEDAQKSSQLVTGKLDGAITIGTSDSVVVEDDDTYTLGASPLFYLNGSRVTTGELPTDADIKVFLNADETVRAVVANKFTVTDLELSSKTTLTTAKNGQLTFAGPVVYNVDKDTKFFLNGNEATYADLEKGQYVNVIASNSNAKLLTNVYATDVTVTGTIDSFTTSGNGSITLDGTAYATKAADVVSGLEVGEEYILFFSVAGKVIKVTSADGTTSEFVGFLAKVDTYTEIKDGRLGEEKTDLHFVTANGTVVVEKDTTDATVVGKVYEVTLTDGKVSDVLENTLQAAKAVESVNGSLVKLTDLGTKRLASDVVVFDASAFYKKSDVNKRAASDVKVVSGVVKGQTIEVFENASLYVDAVVIKVAAAADADQVAPIAGVYQSKYTSATASGSKWYATVKVDASNVTVEITEALYDAISAAKGDLIVLTDEEAVYGVYDAEYPGLTAKTITSVTNNQFTVDMVDYLLTAETEVILKDTSKTTTQIGFLADVEFFAESADYTVTFDFINAVDADGADVVISGATEVAVIVVTYTAK